MSSPAIVTLNLQKRSERPRPIAFSAAFPFPGLGLSGEFIRRGRRVGVQDEVDGSRSDQREGSVAREGYEAAVAISASRIEGLPSKILDGRLQFIFPSICVAHVVWAPVLIHLSTSYVSNASILTMYSMLSRRETDGNFLHRHHLISFLIPHCHHPLPLRQWLNQFIRSFTNSSPLHHCDSLAHFGMALRAAHDRQ